MCWGIEGPTPYLSKLADRRCRGPRFVVPAAALGEWLQLRTALDRTTDLVPCTAEPEAWFAGSTADATAAAVEGCTVCPVVHLCRAYVLAAGAVEAGVWGGLTEADRVELRRGEVAS